MSQNRIHELTIFYSEDHKQSMDDLRKIILADWPILTTTLDYPNLANAPYKQDSEHAKNCSDCKAAILEWLVS